jgi:hypothetical protein
VTTKPEDFGDTIDGGNTGGGGSRWFNREPIVRTSRVRPVGYHWDCPMDGCEGEMRYTGREWPGSGGSPPGCHHKCTKCGFTAAIRMRRFPYVDHEEVE